MVKLGLNKSNKEKHSAAFHKVHKKLPPGMEEWSNISLTGWYVNKIVVKKADIHESLYLNFYQITTANRDTLIEQYILRTFL